MDGSLVVRGLDPSQTVRCRAEADCRLRSLGPTDWVLKIDGEPPIPFPVHAYRIRRGTAYMILPGTGALVLWMQLLGT